VAVTDETLELARRGRLEVSSIVDEETRRLARAWARAWNEVQPAIDDALLDEADTLIERGRLTRQQVDQRTRLRAALDQAEDRIAQLTSGMGVQVEGDADDILRSTDLRQRQQLASQLPGTTAEVAARFDQLDPDTLDRIVARTTEQIEARSQPLAAESREAMRRELTRAVPVGENPREAARRMTQQVAGGFDGGLARATRISRTELLDAHRAGAAAVEQANSDVTAGWRWMAELDEVTCPACVARHGTEHEPGTRGPDDHPNGRCTRIPLTRTWRELGIDQDEPAEQWLDADTWISQNPDQAREALGPGRYEALQEGRISRDQMARQRRNPDWRDSWDATPLRDLL